MIDGPNHSDHPDSILHRFKLQLDSIFDDLSSKYERGGDITDVDGEFGLGSTAQQVVGIISSFWNIPEKMVQQDLLFEKLRQEKNEIAIPDIPTYQIRFALEEGSWVVLLRDYSRPQIKENFNRLMTLEEIIWETGDKSPENIAYYLLELYQLGNTWIKTIYEFWKNEHEYGKIEEFAPFVISAYHNVSISRGRLMWDGAKRILRSKLDVFKTITELKTESPWSLRAKKYYRELAEDFQNEKYSNQTSIVAITLALLQKELIIKKQQVNENSSKFEKEGDLTFNDWKNFDTKDQAERRIFSEKIIRLLYQREEQNPINAGKAVITHIFNKFDLPSEFAEIVIKNFEEKIESNLPLDNKKESKIVELVQNYLPKSLIEFKKEEDEFKEKFLKQKDLNNLPIWDSFEATIQRVGRIKDPDISKGIIKKSVKSVYETLIEMKLSPQEATEEILMQYKLKFDIDKDTIKEMENNIFDIEGLSEIQNELAKLDKILINNISEQIHQITIDQIM